MLKITDETIALGSEIGAIGFYNFKKKKFYKEINAHSSRVTLLK
jgi:hypothetical protein